MGIYRIQHQALPTAARQGGEVERMHPFIIVISGRKMLRVTLLSATIIGLLSFAYAERHYAIEVFSGGIAPPKPPMAIRDVKTDKKQIALTFDISWGEERSGPILDILEQKGIKSATFFLSGPWARQHPHIVERIAKTYEIASHGHKHINYSNLGEQQIREQILEADTILTKLTGKKPKLIRYPNGDGSDSTRVLGIASKLGYTSIHWGTDSKDWMNPGADKIIKNVVKKAHPGDIVLLHASDTCKQTHLALPTIIDQLKGEGYTFVTVSELLSDAGVRVNPVD